MPCVVVEVLDEELTDDVALELEVVVEETEEEVADEIEEDEEEEVEVEAHPASNIENIIKTDSDLVFLFIKKSPFVDLHSNHKRELFRFDERFVKRL
jgi:hypothetical protein